METRSGEPRRPRMPRHVGETLTELAHVTNELTTATTVDAVSKIVTQHMADAVGATIAALGLLQGADEVRLIGLRGLAADEAAGWQVFPLASPNTLAEAVRTGERIVLVGAAEIAERYPELTSARRGERTTVTVPLRTGGRTIGAIHLSIPDAVELHPAELEFLDVLADTCAQSLDRIEAAAVAAKQTGRLAFLAEASIQLASSLDLEATTARVTQLTVPRFADWCAIDIVRDGGLHRLAAAHADPARAVLVSRLQERWPASDEHPRGLATVVRTGEPLLVQDVTDEMLATSARNAEHLAAMRDLGMRSILAVPLLVRGQVSGVLTWASSDPGRRYDEDDVRFAEHLARRAASAIDNADLYGQTRAVAEQLQRAVLPDDLAGTPDWEVAWRYEPSGRTEVGGDFYDAFPLADGRYVAFVGDVMGRGVAASAAMAQMRAAVRAFASSDPSPAAVLDALDRMVVQFDTEQLVTLVYVLADSAEGTVQVANAGHLPPFVLRAHGRVDRLPDADGPPLGLAAGRRSREVAFGQGDALLLVTDGLVERRGEDIEAGLARLRTAARGLSNTSLDHGLQEVLAQVGDSSSDDDVAALVLRRAGSARSGRGGMAAPVRMSA
ncbi:SpoIIE family protein phosphatase [Phycicoccus sp. HDW14]|uniref:GAF domain-containing SpoIIE family protein phosphatase n=1 Tax=Phycicoccus sp. HDW14 TaxID=2714941 RepID=UPI00140D33B3|nr:SpoIIE family protein phosphatase [Phycicoccus sp. HDW14]QIM21239.1 SpoIIE family protein phosphatase [Phycicoccus sp. HDW14]